MRTEVIIMILLMAAVTYIPRTVPSFVIDRLRLGKRMEKLYFCDSLVKRPTQKQKANRCYSKRQTTHLYNCSATFL